MVEPWTKLPLRDVADLVGTVLTQLREQGPLGIPTARKQLEAVGLPTHLVWNLIVDCLEALPTKES